MKYLKENIVKKMKEWLILDFKYFLMYQLYDLLNHVNTEKNYKILFLNF
jgi:hypothetical protein